MPNFTQTLALIMRPLLLISIITTLLIRCGQKTDNKILDFGSFSLEVPYDWSKFELQGIDSHVGGITNGEDSLIFDYGWYSYSFRYEDPEFYNYSLDTVNGKAAIIIRPIETGNGIIGIYIEKASGDNRFNLIGSDIKNEDVVLEIFKTIRFKNSTSNHVSENFAENFEPYTEMKRNEKLFDSKCGSCHFKNDKYMTGPGLLEMNKNNFDLWLKDSLPLPDSSITEFVAGPSFHRKLGKECSKEELSILREMFQ